MKVVSITDNHSAKSEEFIVVQASKPVKITAPLEGVIIVQNRTGVSVDVEIIGRYFQMDDPESNSSVYFLKSPS